MGASCGEGLITIGTRADFYVGRGPEAEWLGSIAWDGYPDGNPADVIRTTDEADWRTAVAELLDHLDHATKPEQGWPWPWNDSGTTDYAYAFDDGQVWATGGDRWWAATEPEPEDDAATSGPRTHFPDMSTRKNVSHDRRSGLLYVERRWGS